MTVDPGRLISKGAEDDFVDAEALLGVLTACEPVRERWTAGTTHVVRQAVWSFWEKPRLPRPLVASKYPKSFPWSPAARAVLEAHPKAPAGGRGLVLEHVRPLNILIDTMIVSSLSWDERKLIDYLDRFLAAAVITKAEDALLTTAGVGKSPLDQHDPDPWARYRTAGLDPDTFATVI